MVKTEYECISLLCSVPQLSDLNYQILDGFAELNDGCRCIVVKTLNIDYFLLLNSVDLIVTENGSRLSHLAIVAGEHGTPVLLCKGIISKIAPEGKVSVRGGEVEFEG